MFFNPNDFIGIVLTQMTDLITGSLFISLLMVFIALLAVCLVFGIPMEFSGVILLPLCLAIATYESHFVAPLGVILIYFAFVLLKSLPFR